MNLALADRTGLLAWADSSEPWNIMNFSNRGFWATLAEFQDMFAAVEYDACCLRLPTIVAWIAVCIEGGTELDGNDLGPCGKRYFDGAIAG